MERLTSDQPVPEALRGAVIALGNFDGFHGGHQAVVARARALAVAESRPLIVATFDPHPVRFFQPMTMPFRLTTLDQRERLFAKAGSDAILVFLFNAELAAVSAEEFIGTLLAERAGAAAVVTGQDFTFGKGRTGSVAVLKEVGPSHGIRAEAVAPIEAEGGPISSSRIRRALIEGDCRTAAQLLTRPFTIQATVEHGAKLGRELGYPTANLRLGDYLRPAYGIYAVRGLLPDGRMIDGAANIGIRPTIEPPEELLEVHFFDFSENLYGQTIEVELIQWLRPEAKFDSLDALKNQMAVDCEQARTILAATPRNP